MYRQVVECLHTPTKEFEKKFNKIDKLEDESDVVEVEIADYLTESIGIQIIHGELATGQSYVQDRIGNRKYRRLVIERCQSCWTSE